MTFLPGAQGDISIRRRHRHQGLALPYRTFDRITPVDQGAVIENKRLSEALEMYRAMQAELPPKLLSRKAPARTTQAEHMLGVS